MHLSTWVRIFLKGLLVSVIALSLRCNPNPRASRLADAPAAAGVSAKFAQLVPNGIPPLQNRDSRQIWAASAPHLGEVLSENTRGRQLGGSTSRPNNTRRGWNNGVARYQERGPLQTQRGR
jgi:hypothetical protein